MAVSSPPDGPSVSQVFARSFADAGSLTAVNRIPVAIFLVLSTLAAAVFVFSMHGLPQSALTYSPSPLLTVFILCADVAFAVISYYSIAAAVRTVHPEFRMTFARFWGFFGYALLAGLLIGLSELAFIIPMFWVAPKVILAPYVYALGAAEPVKTSWNMTTGYYWNTVGLLLLAAVSFTAIVGVTYLLCAAVAFVLPVTIIVIAPLVALVVSWTMHAHALAYVRWSDALIPRAGAGMGAATPSPA